VRGGSNAIRVEERTPCAFAYNAIDLVVEQPCVYQLKHDRGPYIFVRIHHPYFMGSFIAIVKFQQKFLQSSLNISLKRAAESKVEPFHKLAELLRVSLIGVPRIGKFKPICGKLYYRRTQALFCCHIWG
jgi:hypothetical protein